MFLPTIVYLRYAIEYNFISSIFISKTNLFLFRFDFNEILTVVILFKYLTIS